MKLFRSRFNWAFFRWWEWVLLYTLIAYQAAPTAWLTWLGVPTGWPWPNTVFCVLFIGLMAKVWVRSHQGLRRQRSSGEGDPRSR